MTPQPLEPEDGPRKRSRPPRWAGPPTASSCRVRNSSRRLASPVSGSVWAIADEGKAIAATLVTTGVAISILPVLIRLLLPLAREARRGERDPDYAITVVGLFVYVLVVGGVIALINID